MVGAFFLVHMAAGFHRPAGFEFVFILFASTLALALCGPDAWSVDERMVQFMFLPYTLSMAFKTKLDRNGRVVLPAEARRALGIEAGDALSVEVVGDSLVLRTFAATVDAARARLRESLGAEATASLSDDLIALRRNGLWRD